MKLKYISIVFILITLNSYGQITFEKGYFINNDGQRIECLIKNNERQDNPKEFKYKLTEEDEPKSREIDSTKEFGILGVAKFIRANTKIDRSPSYGPNNASTPYYSDNKDPMWSEEQLFLKVLLEGKASLYSYSDANSRRYFYSVDDTVIKQLIHKEYQLDNTDGIKTNNMFRLQLWEEVKCPDAEVKSVEKLNYKQNELESYFIKYNSCIGSSHVSYVNKEKRDFFHLRFTPGINFSSFSVTSNPTSMVMDFKNKINLRLGLDAEIILPFNRNKWAVVIEPTYNSFNSEAESIVGKVNIAYNYIEFPFGIRYYCFLGKGLSLFFNGSMILGTTINFSNSIDFELPAGSIIIEPFHSIHNYSVGSGVDYKRISAEIRYYTSQNPLFPNETWTSEYNRFAFILGFKIL